MRTLGQYHEDNWWTISWMFLWMAKDYPELKSDDVIVICMKPVTRPDLWRNSFDKSQGDIVSTCVLDWWWLVYPSANIGDHICIFEAVHGAPDIAGKILQTQLHFYWAVCFAI